MTRKTTVVLSIALTALMLIMAGALAVRIGDANRDAALAAADPTATADPATVDSLMQREQLYQQRLEEANAQLQQAYDRIQQLEGQLQQAQVVIQQLQQAVVVNQQLQPSAPAGEFQAGRFESHEEWEHENGD